jgi:hypothetical protein
MSGGAQAVLEALRAFSRDDEERAKLVVDILAGLAVPNGWQVEAMADLAEAMLRIEAHLDQVAMDNRVLQ